MPATHVALGLDLGSDVQRATDHGGAVLRHRSPTTEPAPVRRGRVADEDAFDRVVRSLVPRGHRGPVRLSVPSGSDEHDELRSHAALALPRAAVTTVSAPVAAVEGALPGRRGPVLVVDLGAELTEVSWVEPTGFHVGTSLPWGVSDLRADLLRHLRDRHGLQAPGRDLGLFWAGGTVAGRCCTSGAARVVRVTGADVDAVVAPRLPEVARLLQLLQAADRRTGGEPVTCLLVGGGALIPDLRRRLESLSGLHWTVPADPVHTVLQGLTGGYR